MADNTAYQEVVNQRWDANSKEPITAVVQIGNSDNKLSQNEWACFAAHMKLAIESNVFEVHFSGGSDWDAPWQNACWVCLVNKDQIQPLIDAVSQCRNQFNQDSAAITWGATSFV